MPEMTDHHVILTRSARPTWADALERVPLLTARETETLALLGAGWSNRRISAHLEVTERTVKAHVACVLGKLQVESRLQAGLVALSYRYMYEGTYARKYSGSVRGL